MFDETITPFRGASLNIDMRVHTPLADQLQFGQPAEQRRKYPGALANQHQRFGIAQPPCQGLDLLNVIRPDLDIMAFQFLETGERSQGVMVVVQYRDLHGLFLFSSSASSARANLD